MPKHRLAIVRTIGKNLQSVVLPRPGDSMNARKPGVEEALIEFFERHRVKIEEPSDPVSVFDDSGSEMIHDWR